MDPFLVQETMGSVPPNARHVIRRVFPSRTSELAGAIAISGGPGKIELVYMLTARLTVRETDNRIKDEGHTNGWMDL